MVYGVWRRNAKKTKNKTTKPLIFDMATLHCMHWAVHNEKQHKQQAAKGFTKIA
jgi:hypothetical protein